MNIARSSHGSAAARRVGGPRIGLFSASTNLKTGRRTRHSSLVTRHFSAAFTLIEIMVAIGIFAMVLAAIYSSWTAILRASKVGQDVAASVQRTRIAIRMLEDSLGSAQSYAANLPYYFFLGDPNEGTLSFVARLAKSFPRSGKFGDLDVRRVTFSLESGPEGSRQLVMRQMPLVMEEPDPEEKDNPIVLVKNVKEFEMQFLDTNKNPPEWVEDWKEAKTNQLPARVMITLKYADSPRNPRAVEEITRIISLSSVTVQRMWQVPPVAGRPGAIPGQPPQPGIVPQPGYQPGVQPGMQPGYQPGVQPGVQPGRRGPFGR